MSLPPEILQQRYGAIELAYSEQRWPEVESLSEALLAELAPNPADPLQLRLVLLLGHTKLYGMADPTGALLYYNSVLEHCEEPTLREIAQQGQAHCGQQVHQPSPGSGAAAPWMTSADLSADSESPQLPGATAGSSADATPWLAGEKEAEPAARQGDPIAAIVEASLRGDSLASDAPPTAPEPPATEMTATEPVGQRTAEATNVLVPEIVDEPEQIAVAQAGPLLRQELAIEDLTPPESVSTETPPDPGELSAEQIDDLARGLLRIRLS